MSTKPQKIAVLGAGIAGLSSASALSRAGHDITLFDPAGFPNMHSASAIAGGMLAPYAEIEHMPQTWIEAGLSAIELWQEYAQTHDIGLARSGSLLIAHNEDRYILERFRAHLPAALQTAVTPQELEPALPAKFQSALFLPAEAHLNPVKTLAALHEDLRSTNVTFRQEAALPDTIAAQYDVVIDARGMAAAQDDPDLRGVKGETLVVRNPEFTLERPLRLMHPRYPLYIVPRGDGVFMIGATQIESEGERPTLRSGLELMSALYSLAPSFGEAEILEINAGLRPSYPDNLPRLTLRGNVIGFNGMFRHGFLLSPLMAQCVADYVAGEMHKFIPIFIKDKRNENENNDKRKTAKLHRAA